MMATSGTYNFAVTRDQIITASMKFIRRLDELEVPTPQDITDCSLFLNMLTKQWMGKTDFAPGLKTWTRVHCHLFLSSTTGQYTVGPNGIGWTASYAQATTTQTYNAGAQTFLLSTVTGMTVGDNFGIVVAGSNGPNLYWSTIQSINAVAPVSVTITGSLPYTASSGAQCFDYTTAAQQPLEIETAFLRDIYNVDTPLRILTLPEYDLLPNKVDTTSISDPSAIYYEFLLNNSYLYTDIAAAQDVTKHIAMTCMMPVQDFDNSTDQPYFPQEWYLPLVTNLAKLVAPMFGSVWTPGMEDAAKTSLAVAQQKAPERVVLFFQPGEDGI